MCIRDRGQRIAVRAVDAPAADRLHLAAGLKRNLNRLGCPFLHHIGLMVNKQLDFILGAESGELDILMCRGQDIALIPQQLEQVKRPIARLRDSINIHQAKGASKRLRQKGAFLKNIGKAPEGAALHEILAIHHMLDDIGGRLRGIMQRRSAGGVHIPLRIKPVSYTHLILETAIADNDVQLITVSLSKGGSLA